MLMALQLRNLFPKKERGGIHNVNDTQISSTEKTIVLEMELRTGTTSGEGEESLPPQFPFLDGLQ